MSGSEEIGQNQLSIKRLPRNVGAKESTSEQGMLDLRVDRQKEVQGVGMGVLSDGTSFLTQRGLARLCGVHNTHIGTIGAEWNEGGQKPRILAIKEILKSRGITVSLPHMELVDGARTIYAYPDSICLAILEYYAFDAGQNCKEQARKNFRILAGTALQEFIYAEVGYAPYNRIPEVWRKFHDRVSLVYDSVPPGFFSVYKEIAGIVVTLINAGAPIGDEFVPDISVGQHWSKYWCENELKTRYGERRKYIHNYPEYFPQSASNPQLPFCYPDIALAEFRKWIREIYIPSKFPTYLKSKERQGALPPSFSEIALAALESKGASTSLPNPA